MIRFVAILAFLISFHAIGIVGGQKATKGQFPSTVFILNTMCTGVKIGPYHYLTARHCGKINEGEKLRIQWKMSINLEALEQEEGTASLTIQKNYTQTYGNLTVFQVLEEIPSLPSVPIRIDSPPNLGETVTINGYGCINHLGYKHPYNPEYFPFEQKFSLKYVSNMNSLFIELPYQDPDGIKVSSICYADSGGPLYSLPQNGQAELVGIAEFISTTETGEVTSNFNRLDEKITTMPGELSAGTWLKKILSMK